MSLSFMLLLAMFCPLLSVLTSPSVLVLVTRVMLGIELTTIIIFEGRFLNELFDGLNEQNIYHS